MSFAIWLTGLSGSGKSAIAKALLIRLREQGVQAAVLESDVLRKQLTPFPTYEEAERKFFYNTISDLGAQVVAHGMAVIFDAAANKRSYRERARRNIARFAEVFVDTPLEVCAARDPKGLYRAAHEGALSAQRGAQVADYEPPLAAELVLSGARGTSGDAAGAIIALLERRGWLSGTPARGSRRSILLGG